MNIYFLFLKQKHLFTNVIDVSNCSFLSAAGGDHR